MGENPKQALNCWIDDESNSCMYIRFNMPDAEWSEEYSTNVAGCLTDSKCRYLAPELFDCY